MFFSWKGITKPVRDFVAVYDLITIIETEPPYLGATYPEIVERTDAVRKRGLVDRALPDIFHNLRSSSSHRRIHAVLVLDRLDEDACSAMDQLEKLSEGPTLHAGTRADIRSLVERFRKHIRKRGQTASDAGQDLAKRRGRS